MYTGFFFGSGMESAFSLVLLIVIGLLVFTGVKGIIQWNNNNHCPRLTVPAVVTAKRTCVDHRQIANAGDATGAHGFHTTITTSYYVTFQVESGDRMEFLVKGSEYGALAEGDHGKLSFQGTRFQGFSK